MICLNFKAVMNETSFLNCYNWQMSGRQGMAYLGHLHWFRLQKSRQWGWLPQATLSTGDRRDGALQLLTSCKLRVSLPFISLLALAPHPFWAYFCSPALIARLLYPTFWRLENRLCIVTILLAGYNAVKTKFNEKIRKEWKGKSESCQLRCIWEDWEEKDFAIPICPMFRTSVYFYKRR